MNLICARLTNNYEVFCYLLDNGCEFDIELAKKYGLIFTKENEEQFINYNGELY